MSPETEALVTAIDRALDEWERVTLPEMNGDADALAEAMDALARARAEAMTP
jgi:hypothetical protein